MHVKKIVLVASLGGRGRRDVGAVVAGCSRPG